MIKLMGLKRLVILVVLGALNLLVLAAYMLSFGPMLDGATAERDAINAQISDTQMKLANIKKDALFVKENIPLYQKLVDQGFFLNQDRFMIQRTMDALRQKAGISSFNFSVTDVTEVPNASAAGINYKLLNSRIKIDNIISPLDNNVYLITQEMSQVFPSFARLQTLDVAREKDVTEAALKDIAAGKSVNFVNAAVEFDWITMVPKQAETPAGTGEPVPSGFRRQ